MNTDQPRDPFELGEVRRMRLQPGDVVVIECNEFLTRAGTQMLRERLTGAFEPAKVVVLPKGLHLSAVVGPDEDLPPEVPR